MTNPEKKIRSIFTSDQHLGSKFSRADLLNEFLAGKNPKFFFLVGDFIDGWKFAKRKWYWTDDCTKLIRKILKMGKRGTKICWLLGNHDDFARRFLKKGDEENRLAGITIANSVIHDCADGRRCLVVHGDAFDSVIQYTPWLAWIGDFGYETMLRLNYTINRVRTRFGMKHWSFSKFIKTSVKKAVAHIDKFEEHLVVTARRQQANLVVCGHIHSACDRSIDGIRYMNCGDWVESCTAIIEYEDGTWELHDHFSQKDALLESMPVDIVPAKVGE